MIRPEQDNRFRLGQQAPIWADREQVAIAVGVRKRLDHTTQPSCGCAGAGRGGD